MQSLITRILFFIILLFPLSSNIANGYYIGTSNPQNNLTKNVSTTINFEIHCNDSYYITNFWQRTGSQTAGTLLRLTIDSNNYYATTTSSSELINFNISPNVECLQGTILQSSLTAVSGDTTYTVYRSPKTLTGVTVPYSDSPLSIEFITSDPDYGSHVYSGAVQAIVPHVLSAGGGGNTMATTTVITANDQLINFTLLFVIFLLTIFAGVMALRPFYARK